MTESVYDFCDVMRTLSRPRALAAALVVESALMTKALSDATGIVFKSHFQSE